MKKWFYVYTLFFLISLNGFCQYDSIVMDKFITKYLMNENSSDLFARVSDSLFEISKSENKRYLIQVNHKGKLQKNKYVEAISMNGLGLCYLDLGSHSEAYTCFTKALVIFKELKSNGGIFNATSNIGILYSYMGQYKKALVYDLKALSIVKSSDKINSRYTKCTNICLNIGSMYGYMNNLPLAQSYFYKALAYYNQDAERDSITKAYIFNNISDTYLYSDDIINAEKFSDKAFDIKLKYGNNDDKADAYLHRGEILSMKGEYNSAKNMFLQALTYKDTLVPTVKLRMCYTQLSFVYDKLKDYKNESKFLKLKYRIKGYLDSASQASEINNIEIKNEFRQQTVNDSIQNIAQLKIRDVKIEQKKRESVYGIIALLIMSMLAFLFFKRYKLSQKQKLLIEEQKKIVDEKNHEITDSINYAKNLQDALIPDSSELLSFFSGAFVLYFPKDIVAGDFYWWHRFPESGKILVAVADCTGHGVPGAMVSVVCINALNRAVNEFNLIEPNEILDKVNLLVNETFSKNNKQVNDGMDISLLLIDAVKKEVKWSGANNKLIYFINKEAVIVKPNKQPIGKNEKHTPFHLNALPYVKDAVFYLLTDGFSDQFGGEKNKKMGFSNFKELIEKNHEKPLTEQKVIFESAFKNWKGSREQTDDVSLIGIKL